MSEDSLEKRLANTAMALVGLLSLIEGSLLPDEYEIAGRMMEDYFVANRALGGFKKEQINFNGE